MVPWAATACLSLLAAHTGGGHPCLAHRTGLLKWSLAQNDGTHPTEFKPLTDEEKAFLKGAMAELTFDPHKLAKECIRVVNLPDNPALDPPDEPAAEGKGGEDGSAAGAATSTGTSLGSGSGAGAGAGAGAAPAATAVDGDSAPRDAGTTTGGADASGGAETAATPDAAATSAEVGSGVAVSGEVAPGSGADAAGVSGGADADAGTASSDTPVTTLAVGGAVASASASGRPPVTFEERRVAKEEALQTLLDYVADHDNAQRTYTTPAPVLRVAARVLTCVAAPALMCPCMCL